MKEKEKIKRNDKILDLLIKIDERENRRNEFIDSKSSSTINIIILILTIECTILGTTSYFWSLLLTKPLSLRIILCITLIITLLLTFVSLRKFIKSYTYRSFNDAPSSNYIIKYGKEEKSYNYLITTVIGDYNRKINDNHKIIDDKAKLAKEGLDLLKYAIISLIIFIIMTIITMIF